MMTHYNLCGSVFGLSLGFPQIVLAVEKEECDFANMTDFHNCFIQYDVQLFVLKNGKSAHS